MSVVLFMVFVKFSAIQKISVQNWAIMEMIYMLILFLCNILESYLWLGNEKLQVQKSFRFRRDILNQLSPIRKILIDYQLNLMSFVKIHPSQTNAIQCSVLCPRIIRRHTEPGSTMFALPFFILNSETFPDILFADKQLS